MDQISVPSSLLLESSTGIVATPVGGPDIVDVVNDPEETKWLALTERGGDLIRYGLQALFDPLVDTDHRIHIVVRSNGLPTVLAVNLFLENTSESLTFAVFALTAADLTGVFTELVHTLDVTEVQAIREASAYGDLAFALQVNTALGGDPAVEIDIAYLQFSTPLAFPPPPPVEITGSGGLGVSSGAAENNGTVIRSGGQSGPGVYVQQGTGGLGVSSGLTAVATSFVLHLAGTGGLGVSRGTTEVGGVPTMPANGPGGHPCLTPFPLGTDSGGGSGCGVGL